MRAAGVEISYSAPSWGDDPWALTIADLESGPENDRRATSRPARILSRNVRTLINLHGHDFVRVHELIDVPRLGGLPRHVVDVVLDAFAAQAHTARARDDVPLRPARDTETRNGSENIGHQVRMSVLELIGTNIE